MCFLTTLRGKSHLQIIHVFKRRHSKTLDTAAPSATPYDSQTCLLLQVKQMPPVLEQFPLTTLEVNKFTAQIPNTRGEGSHGMMNEAKSTLRRRTGIDEKLTDPGICGWDLRLCFVAIRLAPREDRPKLRDIGFL